MSKPFFSIIIPALNEEKYLPKLLDDLSKQTFQDFEVIVVDGTSDDQTVVKTKEYSQLLPSLTILTSPKRHVCTQRNLGAKAAQADILIFSDADNRLPSYFLQGLKYRWETQGVDILSPLISSDSVKTKEKIIISALNIFLDLQMSVKPHFLLEACCIISSECFNAVGGFDEAINYGEGTIFMDRAIILGYQANIIKDPTYSYSLRRLKKYGPGKTISNVISLQLLDLFDLDTDKVTFKNLYPMLGGKDYNSNYRIKKNRISKFMKNIKKILKDISTQF